MEGLFGALLSHPWFAALPLSHELHCFKLSQFYSVVYRVVTFSVFQPGTILSPPLPSFGRRSGGPGTFIPPEMFLNSTFL